MLNNTAQSEEGLQPQQQNTGTENTGVSELVRSPLGNLERTLKSGGMTMLNNTLQPPAEALQPPQPQQQNTGTGNTGKGKVLKVLVFEGDLENPKVSVAFPLGLARWAGRLLPQFAKLMPLALDLAMVKNEKSAEFAKLIQEKYTDLDLNTILTTICDMVEEGFDQLAEIGQFDFVTVQDSNTKVQIRIE